jgi:hypothetical protein
MKRKTKKLLGISKDFTKMENTPTKECLDYTTNSMIEKGQNIKKQNKKGK